MVTGMEVKERDFLNGDDSISKPTPGPWNYNSPLSRPSHHFVFGGEKRFLIADVGSFNSDEGEIIANAFLISAAPDMAFELASYEKAMRLLIEGSITRKEAFDKIELIYSQRNALKKAGIQ
jgi:hypothetical protein